MDDDRVVNPPPAEGETARTEVPAAGNDAPAGSAGAPGAAAPPAEDAAVLRDRWLRAEAELQNYRKRAVREREETRRAAEEAVMLEMIAALDDLDRALRAGAEAGVPDAWLSGVRLVAGRLVDFLARQGVAPVDPKGLLFDPALHEAVLEVDAPGVEPGHVAEVVLRGWRRGERALRAARVVVARHAREGC